MFFKSPPCAGRGVRGEQEMDWRTVSYCERDICVRYVEGGVCERRMDGSQRQIDAQRCGSGRQKDKTQDRTEQRSRAEQSSQKQTQRQTQRSVSRQEMKGRTESFGEMKHEGRIKDGCSVGVTGFLIYFFLTKATGEGACKTERQRCLQLTSREGEIERYRERERKREKGRDEVEEMRLEREKEKAKKKKKEQVLLG